MIFIIDRFVEGYLHVLANVNTIKILNSIYPNVEKKFIAEKKHSDLVREQFHKNFKDQKLFFEPFRNKEYLQINKVKQFYRVLNRLGRDLIFFYKLFKSIRKTHETIVFVTHIYPLSLFFIKILKWFFPKIKMIVTIHGEIEYLFYGKTLYENVIGRLYNLTFKIKTSNLYYLFLTKVSKEILINSCKLKKEEILTTILPTLPTNEIIINNDIEKTSIVKIGHIGSAGLRKNTNLLYEIAKHFSKEIEEKRVLFSVIGPIEENLLPYLNENVVNYVDNFTNRHLDRSIFNTESKKIDYSIFFYGQNDFVLRSSAAFFDAIYFEKPMIVLKNDFFVNVFQEAGDLGYICEDLNELKEIIKKVISNDSEIKLNYRIHLLNIKNYKKSLDLTIVSEQLKVQLKDRNLVCA